MLRITTSPKKSNAGCNKVRSTNENNLRQIELFKFSSTQYAMLTYFVPIQVVTFDLGV